MRTRPQPTQVSEPSRSSCILGQCRLGSRLGELRSAPSSGEKRLLLHQPLGLLGLEALAGSSSRAGKRGHGLASLAPGIAWR